MKKHVAVLLLLLGVKLSYAQTRVTLLDKPALYLSADGIMTDLIQKSIGKTGEKTNYVFVAGGFINFHLTADRIGTVIRYSKLGNVADSALLSYSRSTKFYYRTYFAKNGKPGDTKKLQLPDQKANMAYLMVNDVFNIDIFDNRTDTLVKRYSIRRIRTIPRINFYGLNGNKKGTSIQVTENRQFSVSSSDEIALKPVNANDLKNQRISYSLTNLKTGKQQRYTDTVSIKIPKLTANTYYELRCNFDIQPESISTYRIHVKAKWYQLPIVYGLAIGFVILTAAFILIFRLRSKVSLSQKKQTEIEQSILRLQSQLNPHFTFNALSSIQGLMNTNRIAEANDYLQDFSSLLRKTLSKGQQIFNTLDQELEMMQTYIRLEALRYNFKWEIQLSLHTSSSTIEIPTLLLQPVIENAIKHGIASLGEKGILLISCRTNEEDDSFTISIKDNGKWPANKTHTGYGLQLTYDRISAINKLHKEKKIVLNFDTQNGTAATFTFQNWINN